ncbi:hypothetical protein FT663_02293 [Candidozyma haemuli var. vulneris]|nr:hypothetical protein FT663_02293 [[Candida] haemuloni var. vulneris]
MSCLLWDYDDIPRCARTEITALYPLAVAALSLAWLIVTSIASCTGKKIELDESRPLLASPDVYGSVESAERPANQPEISLRERHFDMMRLPNTNEDGTPHGQTVEQPKSLGDRARVSLEFVLVALQLAMAVATLLLSGFSHEWKSHSFVQASLVFHWAYAFALCCARVTNMKKQKIALPNLWAHSTALYLFHVLSAAVFFRSALIGHVKRTPVAYYYEADFAITIVLVFLSITCSVGDKPARIYITSDGVKPSPENLASLWSFSTYSWVDEMIWRARKSSLVMGDIWGLREDDYALHVLKVFDSTKSAARFTIQLFSHFKWLFALQGFWALCESILVFFPTLLLKKVLEYVEDPSTTTRSMAWCLVLLMPASKLIDSLSSGFSLFIGRRVCVRMRAIIIGEVYAKALRRKISIKDVSDDEPASEDEASVGSDDKKKDSDENGTSDLGAIINLMAIDAFKVSEVCGYLHFFVGGTLMLVVCTVLLYNLLGWSALAGSAAIIVFLPINYKLSQWTGEAQKDMLSTTDKRIQKMNETFSSIRIIKFFAWENNFFANIMKIRHDELYYLKKRSILWGLQSFNWFAIPTIITVISFYCYTMIEGKPLTAPIAFTALSFFTLLRAPLDQLADMTAIIIQSKVSLDRVSDFLEEDETSKYEQLGQKRTENSPVIGFEDASFSWNSTSDADFKLRNLNIAFKPGKLNVVIGPTGAGKTSLLMALLGEMELLNGKVFLPGIIPRDELVIDPTTGFTESVAYCSQSAWLLNDTIRNNIIFSQPYIPERYDRVVEACGLTRDLQILPAGDKTEIGEKGIALSGGQKQRISLARALYSNSRHILLDDCLSAVDSHTALWIYENCISGPLMANRTCILVSHNVALTVQKAEWVVVMEDGKVKVQGSADELLDGGHLGDDELVRSSVMNSRNQSTTNLQSLDSKNSEMKSKAAVIESKLKDLAGEEEPTEALRTDGKLIEEEEKAEGVVGLDVYAGYIKEFGGWPTWSIIIFTYGFTQLVYICQSWWLKKWAQDTPETIAKVMNVVGITGESMPSIVKTFAANTNLAIASLSSAYKQASDAVTTFKTHHIVQYYIIWYALIGLAYSVLATIRVFVSIFAGIRASNRIFKRVLTRILSAKLGFFDKTPLGRIMNRFSKDIEAVDQELTPFGEATFACLVSCISIFILITVITPGFLFFAVFISYFYYLIGSLYITLSRELKRFDSITKSPIHQHFSESLTGVATIRAYGVESRFMKQNLAAIDENNRPFFYMWVANRWLALRVDAVGSLVMLFAGIFVILSIGRIDAGLAGLSLSYAISFSENALWIVRLYANVEMNMNSVERLQEFMKVDQEPPSEIPETTPKPEWPTRGEIEVKDVSLRYAPHLPRVIKNVTFHVEPSHKIGVVGRTGAGKSTIITAFFRFLDPETGYIKIDDVDICSIGLRNLRQAITIIPQDPTLFTGTIRSNLDPFDQYSDAQIFEALKRVNLIGREETARDIDSSQENKNKFLDLSSAVSEGGNNLSQGQRQLMCLARSLLKSPKVILLDEATASIDYQSDAMIQQTIREEFSGSTILTIAHRLRSIIDYDKILVMDAGKVVEYDDPYALIANKETLFYSMCENSGELEVLAKLAKESFVSRKNKK